jgi:23S rRNA pseudouridine1911/1915/1917 synthase
MEPKIIFEDDSLFVVEKPSGWITNDADTTTNQPVLQTWARENFDYPLKGNREMRDGIVHRLDKETSGIVVIAKTESAFTRLQAEFKNREVTKTYIALLHGRVQRDETRVKRGDKDGFDGTISVTVGRLPWHRSRFGILSGGRESTTGYKVMEFFPGNNAGHSLVEFYPKTGRTHQLRIHSRHIGHAIVSDEFYAGRKTARNDRKWCPRLFLHATSIKFLHPVTGKEVEYKSDLPDDLKDVLLKLKK